MAEIVFVLGNSGTGKSYSTKNLDPNSFLLFDIGDKTLPYRNNFADFNSKAKTGNIVHTSDINIIYKTIEYCEKNCNFDIYVFDDFQYLMSFEFFERTHEHNFQKFTDIGGKIYKLLQYLKKLPKNKICFILSHTEDIVIDNVKHTKIKTIGKMLDEKLTVESLATIVLGTQAELNPFNKTIKYSFITQNIGNTTFKSPAEMFDSIYIDNDLSMVANRIKEFYPNIFNKQNNN